MQMFVNHSNVKMKFEDTEMLAQILVWIETDYITRQQFVYFTNYSANSFLNVHELTLHKSAN